MIPTRGCRMSPISNYKCLVCVAVVCVVFTESIEAQTTRPIIGILSQKSYDQLAKYGPSYIAASYVKFLESGGARAVLIPVNQTNDYYTNLFNSINGILFPGGTQYVDDSSYGTAGQILYNLAIKANDGGDFFPLWGTCLGHELLTYVTAGKNLLANTNAHDVLYPVHFTKDFRSSRLFRLMPDKMVNILANQNITYNHHRFGLTPQNYTKNEKLRNFYQIISTSKDEDGLEFISIMEAYKYPFYGVQWHPEKNNFEWMRTQNVNHSEDAVLISEYLANFFVEEARKSSHKFSSTAEELAALSYSYTPIYTGKNTNFQQCYFLSD
ncbi:gamma-glutamyl hydrolase-like [Saccoglossus kowalevskii]|uniref:folate gamma-glutamyl hydrolase n=1 Tax=Saccoglossus kowalevskii TaxID=10224 RepID=A0ABM0GZB7_SACKO|nr:PREDICTED: gamma-glutamyl hydrolase-like [Saccoglossus kowalevskii]